ncbi:MAG: arylesterase [Desulfocapsaceae bacterium]
MMKSLPTNILAGLLCGMILTVALAGCKNEQKEGFEASREATVSYDGVIMAMGDSLTAGLGVSPQNSYPALLEQMLHERGLNYRVINGGVSGETSSGAKSRVDWIISMKPDLVILVTGANDGLRGIDPALIRDNIAWIISELQAADIEVVLGGMKMSTNMGQDYVSQFNRLYPELAAAKELGIIEFFLEGVALRPEFNQADGIHPNEQGYRVIAENILPHVLEALERIERRNS